MNTLTQLARFASFETQQLTLRPVRFSDSSRFFDMVSTPKNARFILPPLTNRSASDNLLVTTFMHQPLGVWGICQKPSDDLIGIIRFEHLDIGNGRAELSYLLRQAEWGQGLMTEAVKTLTFLAFQELKFRELTIICHLENIASQRVAEKAGFTLKNRFRGSDRYSHKVTTYLTYQLNRGDYRYE